MSGDEAIRTYPCRTEGCAGEAKANSGRCAYCLDCMVRRGTAYADGRLVKGPVPSAPGSKAKPKRASRPRASQKPAAGPPSSLNGSGPYETKAVTLIEAGRELDEALERYRAAKGRWREAIVALTKAPESPASS